MTTEMPRHLPLSKSY